MKESKALLEAQHLFSLSVWYGFQNLNTLLDFYGILLGNSYEISVAKHEFQITDQVGLSWRIK